MTKVHSPIRPPIKVTRTAKVLALKTQYKEKAPAPKKTGSVAEPQRTNIWEAGTYAGEDLRPYDGRPGANDFLRYPSRMGDELVYRKEAA